VRHLAHMSVGVWCVDGSLPLYTQWPHAKWMHCL
jgi:hypothetical protein